jgi:MOSC domain-containing protein YiiM
MAALARSSGATVTSERFRPNFVVNTGDEQGDYPERAWRGCRLLLGEAELQVCAETFRCGMPAHHQSAKLPKAPEIVKTIYGELGSKFGVYARVVRPGKVRLGDRVVLATRPASPLTVLEDLGTSMKRAVLEAFLSL